MNEFELALHDLYTAIRLSGWNDTPHIYEIDGTAEIIAEAVIALVQKRRSTEGRK